MSDRLAVIVTWCPDADELTFQRPGFPDCVVLHSKKGNGKSRKSEETGSGLTRRRPTELEENGGGPERKISRTRDAASDVVDARNEERKRKRRERDKKKREEEKAAKEKAAKEAAEAEGEGDEVKEEKEVAETPDPMTARPASSDAGEAKEVVTTVPSPSPAKTVAGTRSKPTVASVAAAEAESSSSSDSDGDIMDAFPSPSTGVQTRRGTFGY